MPPNIQEQLDRQEAKISEILQSVKKTEKYMRITFWATLLCVILPVALLALSLPAIIRLFTSTTLGVGLDY